MKTTKISLILLIFSLILPLAAQAQDPVTFNDPLISAQWYLNYLKMSQVWAYGQGEGQVIAVLDSGVDVTHPDLVNQIWHNNKEIVGDGKDNDGNGYIDDYQGWDFVNNDNDPRSDDGTPCFYMETCNPMAFNHGTIVAGMIAGEANNYFGIAGLAPKARIMPLRILDEAGNGNYANMIKAVDYAVKNGATVINMSFAGLEDDGEMMAAVDRAYKANVAVVVAAGNRENGKTPTDLDFFPRYPICGRNVDGKKVSFGVGSEGANGKISSFSNYGSKCVDLLAPGENILSTVAMDQVNNNEYFKDGYQGTSVATPIVSSAIALIRSYRPDLSLDQVYELLRSTADDLSAANPGYENKIGAGGLDILKAFQRLEVMPIVKPVYKPLPGLEFGMLLKTKASSTVYYYALDGKRWVFPGKATFLSWYPDYSGVKTITAGTMKKIKDGGTVTIRPGVLLVKKSGAPGVYAISKGGVLRLLAGENVAQSIYGPDWKSQIVVMPTSIFNTYKIGTKVSSADDYSALEAITGSKTIAADKGL